MGFGILIFGYFLTFAFALSNYYFFADIIGALVMIFAFSKLSEYNRYFIGAMWACLAFLALCATGAASFIWKLYDPVGTVDIIVDTLKAVASVIMHILMYLGIRGLSLSADAVKITNSTKRNMIITLLYYVLSAIMLIFSSREGDGILYFRAVTYLLWGASFVLNLVMIYKCFATLCPADEDEFAKKRSRFAIINKMNDKFDSLDEKSNAYRRQSMELAMEEAKKRSEEKLKKKKNKNKKKRK